MEPAGAVYTDCSACVCTYVCVVICRQVKEVATLGLVTL